LWIPLGGWISSWPATPKLKKTKKSSFLGLFCVGIS
jgi:hypothetical protein